MSRSKPAMLSALAAALLLAGCATPQPGIQVRTVPVPTPVPCVKREEIPAEPDLVGDKLTGQAAADLVTVGQSALELRRWGRAMRSVLEACAE